MVGLGEPEPNARGERVRLRKCKQCSAKRESPGFIRGECQDADALVIIALISDSIFDAASEYSRSAASGKL